MPTQERFLPRRIGRFNYWEFFWPGGIKVVDPVKQYIRQQFHLLLTASPAVWDKEVRPWLHKKLADIPDRRFLALEGYVLDDKEWDQDADAWKVYRQLSSRQQIRIQQLSKKQWHYQSQWNWDTLLKFIANDQELFLRYCDRSLTDQELVAATNRRVFQRYSQQAIFLLGRGGRYISPACRKPYRAPNPLDGSDKLSLLSTLGRIDSSSIIDGIDWLKCTSHEERRKAKKRTLHWFHHALRNTRNYRNNRLAVPWSHECAESCHRIQRKLCT